LLFAVFEKKNPERAKFCTFLTALHAGGFLSVEEVTRGIMQALNEIDDISIDVPLAGSYTAIILGYMVHHQLFNLGLLAAIPEENNFSFSTGIGSFVCEVLHSIACEAAKDADADAAAGYSAAQKALADSGINLRPHIETLRGPRESFEECAGELAKKFDLPFLMEVLGSSA